jgi:hypothetical protein
VELVAVAAGVVTRIGPVVADGGTTALILESNPTVKVPATPLKVTDVAPERWMPRIVTVVPTLALEGKAIEIDGA